MHQERDQEAGGTQEQHHAPRDDRPAEEQPPLRRRPRPFPAIDPEPERRYTWRAVRYPAIAIAAAGAVAAVVAGISLAGTSVPARAPAPARFTDRDGLVVFEQPSGLLGTAGPDGGHLLILKNLGALQGSDLPVASADGQHLVNQEGQLVAMASRGPVSDSVLAGGPAGQSPGDSWADVSFADGGKYVVATECDSTGPDPAGTLVADLLPTAGGKAAALGPVTSSAGDPASAGALLSVPAGNARASCDAQPPPDQAVDLMAPGKPARTVITAAALLRALGWSAATRVWLNAVPDPDGGAVMVDVAQVFAIPASPSSGAAPAPRNAQVVVSRTGQITARLRVPADANRMRWSPDGKQIAACSASAGHPSTVSVLAAGGGAVETIRLPGHQDQECEQLLWSPDGSQLIYSGLRNFTGLTRADRVQHGWTVIDVRAGTVHDVAASGQPAAWLPGPGTAAGQGTR
ncbi:MAG TPA: hypothetical protein VHV09_07280 [Trebonia sp.]|nr:hypothetical protein [Trebonia sp.]